MKLTLKQAKVYESFKAGNKTVTAVAKHLGYKLNFVTGIKNRLVEKGLLIMHKHKRIEVVLVDYKIGDFSAKASVPLDIECPDDPLLEKMANVKLSEDQLFYLSNHRKFVKRSELARKLGVSKFVVNMALERMGSA